MIDLSNGKRAALTKLTRRYLRRLSLRTADDLDHEGLLNGLLDDSLVGSYGEEGGDRTLRTDVIRELETDGLVDVYSDTVRHTPLGLGVGIGLINGEVDRDEAKQLRKGIQDVLALPQYEPRAGQVASFERQARIRLNSLVDAPKTTTAAEATAEVTKRSRKESGSESSTGGEEEQGGAAAIAGVVEEMRESLYKRRGLVSIGWEQEMNSWIDRLRAALEQGETVNKHPEGLADFRNTLFLVSRGDGERADTAQWFLECFDNLRPALKPAPEPEGGELPCKDCDRWHDVHDTSEECVYYHASGKGLCPELDAFQGNSLPRRIDAVADIAREMRELPRFSPIRKDAARHMTDGTGWLVQWRQIVPLLTRLEQLASTSHRTDAVARYPHIADCAKCRDCKDPVHDYHVPDDLWAEVVGEEIVLCWDCFAARAWVQDIKAYDRAPYPVESKESRMAQVKAFADEGLVMCLECGEAHRCIQPSARRTDAVGEVEQWLRTMAAVPHEGEPAQIHTGQIREMADKLAGGEQTTTKGQQDEGQQSSSEGNTDNNGARGGDHGAPGRSMGEPVSVDAQGQGAATLGGDSVRVDGSGAGGTRHIDDEGCPCWDCGSANDAGRPGCQDVVIARATDCSHGLLRWLKGHDQATSATPEPHLDAGDGDFSDTECRRVCGNTATICDDCAREVYQPGPAKVQGEHGQMKNPCPCHGKGEVVTRECQYNIRTMGADCKHGYLYYLATNTKCACGRPPVWTRVGKQRLWCPNGACNGFMVISTPQEWMEEHGPLPVHGADKGEHSDCPDCEAAEALKADADALRAERDAARAELETEKAETERLLREVTTLSEEVERLSKELGASRLWAKANQDEVKRITAELEATRTRADARLLAVVRELAEGGQCDCDDDPLF